jgi:hypothetical protein
MMEVFVWFSQFSSFHSHAKWAHVCFSSKAEFRRVYFNYVCRQATEYKWSMDLPALSAVGKVLGVCATEAEVLYIRVENILFWLFVLLEDK